MSTIEDDDDQFTNMIAYFWKEKGDPTRWGGFDAERFKRLLPVAAKAWDDYCHAKAILDMAL